MITIKAQQPNTRLKIEEGYRNSAHIIIEKGGKEVARASLEVDDLIVLRNKLDSLIAAVQANIETADKEREGME